jgi:hypothetical protein
MPRQEKVRGTPSLEDSVKSLKLFLCEKYLANKMDCPRGCIAEKGMLELEPRG